MTKQAYQTALNDLQDAIKKAAVLGRPMQEKRCQAALNEFLSLKSKALSN